MDRAVHAFREALRFDPDFARAQAGLAIALVRVPWFDSLSTDRDQRYEEAIAAARTALQRDPGLAEAHEAIAAVYRWHEFEWETVIQESARALELSPGLDLPHYNMATAFYHLGMFDESDQASCNGLEANPRTWGESLRNRGRTALADGRFETAAQVLGEAERHSDDGPRWMLGEALYYLGEYDQSAAMLERVLHGKRYVMRNRATASMAAMLAARGDRAGAEHRLSTLVGQASPDHHVSYRIGTAYAQLHDADGAVRWLRTATQTGFPCLPCLERDPLLDPIRRHPSFVKLLDELRPTAALRRARYAGVVRKCF